MITLHGFKMQTVENGWFFPLISWNMWLETNNPLQYQALASVLSFFKMSSWLTAAVTLITFSLDLEPYEAIETILLLYHHSGQKTFKYTRAGVIWELADLI